MAGLGRPGPGPRAAMPAWKREILERRRAKLAALGAGAAGPAEPRVLAESLGPLRENPFLRLEAERRRGARPAQPLLDVYRCVPGVRTIRADNILIIESDPGVPPAAGIRAAEVLVFEAPPPGRVSRLLEKFDAPAAPRPRGSPERSRPAPLAPRPAPPAPRPALPAPRPAPGRLGGGAGPGARRGDFLQKTGSNSFTVHPRGRPRGAAAQQLANGPAAPGAGACPAGGLAGEWKPKAESGAASVHSPPSATSAASAPGPAQSPASATPSQRQWVSSATSANDSFEIRPAPKPDAEAIPAGDLQAQALAALRTNSRNSFLFIPKGKAAAASALEGRRSVELPKEAERGAQPGPREDGAPAPGSILLGAEAPSAVKGGCPRPATALADQAVRWQRPSSPPPLLSTSAEAEPAEGLEAPGLAKNGWEPGRPGLPITFIDEVDSEEEEAPQEAKLTRAGVGVPPRPHPHPARPGYSLEHRSSNTFVVVPKRKPGALQEPHLGQVNGEPRRVEAGGLPGPRASPEPTPKKRYPTVHEIEVIGGYLALQKSCLLKAGSSRKKMKISFNDKSLQTTFEYPSESSLVQEQEADAEEEEEEEGEGEEEEEEESPSSEKPFALFLPRATFVSHLGPESSRLLDGSSGLSSYTPKHSVAFSKWQEQTLVQAPSETEPPPKEIMLTPASQNDLSDFRSEPALYF
ncbi:taperin [Ctenodactylus gundi]